MAKIEISPKWYKEVDDSYPETGTCCLCGKEYTHYGNNPYPLSRKPNDRCCDKCNYTLVIPARISALISDTKNEE